MVQGGRGETKSHNQTRQENFVKKNSVDDEQFARGVELGGRGHDAISGLSSDLIRSNLSISSSAPGLEMRNRTSHELIEGAQPRR